MPERSATMAPLLRHYCAVGRRCQGLRSKGIREGTDSKDGEAGHAATLARNGGLQGAAAPWQRGSLPGTGGEGAVSLRQEGHPWYRIMATDALAGGRGCPAADRTGLVGAVSFVAGEGGHGAACSRPAADCTHAGLLRCVWAWAKRCSNRVVSERLSSLLAPRLSRLLGVDRRLGGRAGRLNRSREREAGDGAGASLFPTVSWQDSPSNWIALRSMAASSVVLGGGQRAADVAVGRYRAASSGASVAPKVTAPPAFRGSRRVGRRCPGCRPLPARCPGCRQARPPRPREAASPPDSLNVLCCPSTSNATVAFPSPCRRPRRLTTLSSTSGDETGAGIGSWRLQARPSAVGGAPERPRLQAAPGTARRRTGRLPRSSENIQLP